MSQKNSPTSGSSAQPVPEFDDAKVKFDFSHTHLQEPVRIKCNSLCNAPQWHTGVEINVFKVKEETPMPVKTKRVLICSECGNIVTK